jgi:hypothetical protein
MAGPQKKRDWLPRHDRVILRRWEVSDAKGMPQDNIGVGNRFSTIANPLSDSLRGLARSLRDVIASDPELVIMVYHHH